jgi:outer membrane receptor protein involved in Fe transport
MLRAHQTWSTISLFLLAVVGIALSTSSLRAQIGTVGSLTGDVKDPSGATIPQAQVTLTDMRTSLARTLPTGNDGSFKFVAVRPSSYMVHVEKSGFKVYEQSPIVVEVGQNIYLGVALQVGVVTQSMTVTAQAPMLESESPTMSQVVHPQAIEELPLNVGRSPWRLVVLSPGVTAPDEAVDMLPTGGQGVDFTINGWGGWGGNDFNIDGATARAGDTTSGITPASSTVEQFNVITSNPPAEYGLFTGGVANVITKSGTNSLHGSAYEYDRNDFDMARNTFGATRPEIRFNQGGVNAGGPVWKDHTWVFGAWEKIWNTSGATFTATVPNAAERTGDFSGSSTTIYDPTTGGSTGNRTAFSGNMIPTAQLDPVAQKTLTYIPLPNVAGATINNYYNATPASISIQFMNYRADQKFGENHLLTGAYNRQYSTDNIALPFGPFTGTCCGAQEFHNNSITLAETWNISPSKLNEVHFGYLGHTLVRPGIPGGGPAQLGMPFPAFNNEGFGQDMPLFNVVGYTTFGPTGWNIVATVNRTWQLTDNFSWIRGKHNFKFGTNLMTIYSGGNNEIFGSGDFDFTGNFTKNRVTGDGGLPMADFMLGIPSDGSANFEPSTNYDFRTYSFFAQDAWRVTPSLTLNLGLRWDYEGPTTDRYNRVATFNPTAINPLSETPGVLAFCCTDPNWPKNVGSGRSGVARDYRGWGPRVGFAYRLGNKTTIRGGYGIVYDYGSAFNTTVGFSGYFSTYSPDFIQIPFYLRNGPVANPPYTQIVLPVAHPPNTIGTGGGISYTPPNQDMGYGQHVSFSVQHQLSNNMVFELGYQGDLFRKLGEGWDYEAWGLKELQEYGAKLYNPVPNPFASVGVYGGAGSTIPYYITLGPFPQYSSVSYTGNGGTVNYNAMTARFEKRFAQGLWMLVSYTWSKDIGDVDTGGWRTATPTGDIGAVEGGASGIGCPFDDRKLCRSLTNMDIPQNLYVTWTYALPFGKGQHWGSKVSGPVRHFVEGWEISGIASFTSGGPLGISNAAINPGESGGPDTIGNTKTLSKLNEWFDTSAYAHHAAWTWGTGARNDPHARGDSFPRLDAAIHKRFRITEHLNFTAMLEAFNATNTPIYRNPNTTCCSDNNPMFGVVTSARNPRQLQLGTKLEW